MHLQKYLAKPFCRVKCILMPSRNHAFVVVLWEEKMDGVHPLEYLQSAFQGRLRGGVYQRETGASTGAVHYQCYVQLTTSVSLIKARELLGGCMGCIVANGSWESNVEYCTKEDTRTSTEEWHAGQFGEFVRQGQRLDYEMFHTWCLEMLEDGHSPEDIWCMIDEDPLKARVASSKLPYLTRFLNRKWSRMLKPLEEDCGLMVYHGASGAGKTRLATSRGDSTFVLSMANSGTVWYDGITGKEDTLILDEVGFFDSSHEQFGRVTDPCSLGPGGCASMSCWRCATGTR